jgi:hypothetical protein
VSPEAVRRADGANPWPWQSRGARAQASARLELVGEGASGAPRKHLSKDARPPDGVGHSDDVTFFLRAMPSGNGWTWRLFARTGASGQPKVIYAAERIYPTRREATDRGRRAVATAWAATSISHVKPSVARAG